MPIWAKLAATTLVAGGVCGVVGPFLLTPSNSKFFKFKGGEEGDVFLECPFVAGKSTALEIDWEEKLIKCVYENGGEVSSLFGSKKDGNQEQEFKCDLTNGEFTCAWVAQEKKKFKFVKSEDQNNKSPALRVEVVS